MSTARKSSRAAESYALALAPINLAPFVFADLFSKDLHESSMPIERRGNGSIVVNVEISSRREAQALDLILKSAKNLLERSDHESISKIWEANIAAAIPIQEGLLSQVNLAADLFRRTLGEIKMLTSDQVGELSGSSATNPSGLAATWINRKQIFAVSIGGLGLRYPDFQFQENGKPWPVLAKCLPKLLESFRPTMLLLWFNEPHAALGTKKPLQMLEHTDVILQAVTNTLQPIDFY